MYQTSSGWQEVTGELQSPNYDAFDRIDKIIRILKVERKNIIFHPENPVDPVKKNDFAVVLQEVMRERMRLKVDMEKRVLMRISFLATQPAP